jgi:hypothetical protein
MGRMNLRVQQGVSGRGVFATEAIGADVTILDFTGPLLRYAQTSPQTLALQIGPDLYVGASGGMDDLVNHRCEPNCGLVIKGTDVKLKTLRPISAGEEICFDYSTTMDEDDFEFSCRCDSPTCRKTIRDFKHLPVELRRKYHGLGIVPEYNVRFVDA